MGTPCHAPHTAFYEDALCQHQRALCHFPSRSITHPLHFWKGPWRFYVQGLDESGRRQPCSKCSHTPHLIKTPSFWKMALASIGQHGMAGRGLLFKSATLQLHDHGRCLSFPVCKTEPAGPRAAAAPGGNTRPRRSQTEGGPPGAERVLNKRQGSRVTPMPARSQFSRP